MDCPRCGAQTTSPHECYPPDRDTRGGGWGTPLPKVPTESERAAVTAFIDWWTSRHKIAKEPE